MNGVATVAGFIERLLVREGALVEREQSGALFAVLPPALRSALALAESVTLRPGAAAREGEMALSLESPGLEHCLERALGRGRLAAVRLPAAGGHAKRACSARGYLTALNGTVRAAGTRVMPIRTWVLEFRYEAHSEERADGSVFVAVVPHAEAVSVPLGEALLSEVGCGEPAELPAASDAEAPARLAEPAARLEIRRRLTSFRDSCKRHLASDRERLLAYHATLLAEAGRRRGGDATEEALHTKAAAIARQRDAKLAELAERHAVHVRYFLSSALLVTFETTVFDLVLRRRRRELPVPVVWDPFRHEPLPRACDGCGLATLALFVCDKQGHITCATCAARCAGCGRVTCRACHTGRSCRGCGRDGP